MTPKCVLADLKNECTEEVLAAKVHIKECVSHFSSQAPETAISSPRDHVPPAGPGPHAVKGVAAHLGPCHSLSFHPTLMLACTCIHNLHHASDCSLHADAHSPRTLLKQPMATEPFQSAGMSLASLAHKISHARDILYNFIGLCARTPAQEHFLTVYTRCKIWERRCTTQPPSASSLDPSAIARLGCFPGGLAPLSDEPDSLLLLELEVELALCLSSPETASPSPSCSDGKAPGLPVKPVSRAATPDTSAAGGGKAHIRALEASGAKVPFRMKRMRVSSF